MVRSGQPEPPALLVTGDPSSALVQAALAGVEEEGVPAQVRQSAGDSDAASLAVAAARRSTLEVGLAITDEAIVLTHAKLPAERPIETVSAPTLADARRVGHNAARVVVGIPLRLG